MPGPTDSEDAKRPNFPCAIKGLGGKEKQNKAVGSIWPRTGRNLRPPVKDSADREK